MQFSSFSVQLEGFKGPLVIVSKYSAIYCKLHDWPVLACVVISKRQLSNQTHIPHDSVYFLMSKALLASQADTNFPKTSTSLPCFSIAHTICLLTVRCETCLGVAFMASAVERVFCQAGDEAVSLRSLKLGCLAIPDSNLISKGICQAAGDACLPQQSLHFSTASLAKSLLPHFRRRSSPAYMKS